MDSLLRNYHLTREVLTREDCKMICWCIGSFHQGINSWNRSIWTHVRRSWRPKRQKRYSLCVWWSCFKLAQPCRTRQCSIRTRRCKSFFHSISSFSTHIITPHIILFHSYHHSSFRILLFLSNFTQKHIMTFGITDFSPRFICSSLESYFAFGSSQLGIILFT